ncbi:MAG: hypothetical protein FWF01_03250 [Alphaproteobacteria bacterium]|nr:hypothetical protein [Alphaproteobacteria bacterium]
MTDKLIKYYTEPGKRTSISAEFAARFGKTPAEIMTQVRRMMIHPNEDMDNFSSSNWPRWLTVGDLEKEFKDHDIVAGTCRHFAMLPVAIMRAKTSRRAAGMDLPTILTRSLMIFMKATGSRNIGTTGGRWRM